MRFVPTALTILTACGDPNAAPLADGAYTLELTEVWQGPQPSRQSDPLAEADYVISESPSAVSLAIADDSVVVSSYVSAPVHGMTSDSGPSWSFSLDPLAPSSLEFIGGRLLIWAAGDQLRAELTQFGSGLPVVVSQRGQLEPVD